MDWSDLRGTLDGIDLDTLRPRGDFVLVRENQPEGIQISSHVTITKGKVLKLNNRDKGVRRGVVVAVGRGDRIFDLTCSQCGASTRRTETARSWKCRKCGGKLEFAWFSVTSRCPMHISPGDEIFYPQTPANDFKINGATCSFLHEETQVLGVIDKEEHNVPTMVA
jgi:co-chaperonin GroES (HSP10)